LSAKLLVAQTVIQKNYLASKHDTVWPGRAFSQFISTSDFLDAAISSINSFSSLIKKESYRNKIASFNNPTSSDMGFNLENEIQTALKPLLAKAKNTNAAKFSEVVSSLVGAQGSLPLVRTALTTVNPAFTTLISLVGTLTVQEKKITKDDLDSFIAATSKYFVQYQKLNQANIQFDQDIKRLDARILELQFDSREYLLDMVTILNKNIQKGSLKGLSTEEVLLAYFDKQKMERVFLHDTAALYRYPSDGIKNSKDLAYSLQKLFNEYQTVYAANYQQIRNILLESKQLGSHIDTLQVDASLRELETLYNDSRDADVINLRLKTVFERLKTLVDTEQATANK
jgi:hypothetical protein